MDEVLWYYLFVGVSQNTFQGTFLGCLLEDGTHFFVWGFFLDFDGQINNWHVDGGDSEGHSG